MDESDSSDVECINVPPSPKEKSEDRKQIVGKSKSCKKIVITYAPNKLENVDSWILWEHRSPISGAVKMFRINPNDYDGEHFMFELMTMSEHPRSFFVDNSTVTDGNVYVWTPFDPLFLLIPILSKNIMAVPLEDIVSELLSSKDRVVGNIICSQLKKEDLANIAIRKVCSDIVAYAYCEESTLKWLANKAKKTASTLREHGIMATETSISANYAVSVESMQDNKYSEQYLSYACDIMGEYIPNDLKNKLLDRLGLSKVLERKRKSEALTNDSEENSKKTKTEGSGVPLEDYGSPTPKDNSSVVKSGKAKAKELEFKKAAKGSVSLLKFFAPKNPK